MEESMFTYDYDQARLPSSTSHIRLLWLHPPQADVDVLSPGTNADRFASPIHCDLQTVHKDALPRFKALSYCWGVGGKTHSVLVGGVRLDITESVDSALRHLRRDDTSVVVWIDQICINQADDVEKGDQVRMMTLIYSQAEQVLVWLGPAGQDSDRAMDVYTKVGQSAVDAGFPEYFTKAMYPVLLALYAERNLDDPRYQTLRRLIDEAEAEMIPCLKPLVDLDKREWFRRVWVLQELCLGADAVFMCGNKRVPVDFVRLARLLLSKHDDIPSLTNLSGEQDALLSAIMLEDPSPAFFSARIQWQKYKRGDGPGDTMLDVLRKVFVEREAHATLAQDRIFSLVGIARDTKNREGFRIDYSKTAETVLTDAARAIVEGGDLALLSFAQFPKDHPQLPSWVPDWRPNLRPSFYPYPNRNLDEEHLFAPSGTSTPVVLSGPDDRTLGLTGLLVDTVEGVGNVWTKEGEWQATCLSQIYHICRLSAIKGQPIYASEARRAEAVWRVPIGDIYEHLHRPDESGRAGPRAERSFADWARVRGWRYGNEKLAQSDEEAGTGVLSGSRYADAGMYRLSMAKMMGMRPFITVKGYIGMGPALIRHGDQVVVFFGAAVCSVLRPCGMRDATEMFSYVGEVYCDGIMDGELVGQREEMIFWMT